MGWFKPRQKADEVGDVAQSVYPLMPQDACSAAEKYCVTCGGSLVPGESDLCLSCFKRVSKISVVVLRKG